MPIYLDNNATTRTDPRVLEAMLPFLSGPFANPSSLHRFGRGARDAVEAARAQVAALVGAEASEVIFTSGGTESNNLALRSGLPTGKVLLVSAIEHAAVLEPAEAIAASGTTLRRIPVDADGRIDVRQLDRWLADGNVGLVSVMLANNETGVIEDVAGIAARVHAAGARLHTDAVQAAGKMPLSFRELDVDLMSLSSHKLHGPKGVGALIRRRSLPLTPQIIGGGQESGLRGGTENVAGIVGFGVAAELAAEELSERVASMRVLRDQAEREIAAINGVVIFSGGAERLPNTFQFGVDGFDGEALLMALDRQGIAVSSGSACHSGDPDPSHVLLAMGIDRDLARSAIRVSFSKDNTTEDASVLIDAIRNICAGQGRPQSGVAL